MSKYYLHGFEKEHSVSVDDVWLRVQRCHRADSIQRFGGKSASRSILLYSNIY